MRRTLALTLLLATTLATGANACWIQCWNKAMDSDDPQIRGQQAGVATNAISACDYSSGKTGAILSDSECRTKFDHQRANCIDKNSKACVVCSMNGAPPGTVSVESCGAGGSAVVAAVVIVVALLAIAAFLYQRRAQQQKAGNADGAFSGAATGVEMAVTN